jgi:hypothetical protein
MPPLGRYDATWLISRAERIEHEQKALSGGWVPNSVCSAKDTLKIKYTLSSPRDEHREGFREGFGTGFVTTASGQSSRMTPPRGPSVDFLVDGGESGTVQA